MNLRSKPPIFHPTESNIDNESDPLLSASTSAPHGDDNDMDKEEQVPHSTLDRDESHDLNIDQEDNLMKKESQSEYNLFIF